MKRWTDYLVPCALSMALLTGCINNDEPAGIGDLRGAKAEFIRAKTQFELANVEIQKVKIEREKAALDYDKLLVEIKKIELEKNQTEAAYDKAVYQAKQDSLVAAQQVVMTKIKEKAARAEAEYQKALVDLQLAALTYKDEEFQGKINTLTGQLQGARTSLTSANDGLLRANSNLIDFTAGNKYYEKKLNLQIGEAQSDLSIQEEVLANLQKIEKLPVSEWSKQVNELDNQLAGITKKSQELTNLINAKALEVKPVTDKISLEGNKLVKPDQVFTIPVAKVAGDIQNDLGRWLNGFSFFDNNFTTAFKYDMNIGKYTMSADYASNAISLNDVSRTSPELAKMIRVNYTAAFNTAYNMNGLGSLEQDYNTFFNGRNAYLITDAALAKAQAEIAKMEIYTEKAKDAYKADSTAWADAYLAYFTALKAYGYNPEMNWGDVAHTIYPAVKKALADYNTLAPTDKTDAKRTSLKATLKGYYPKRFALDGFAFTVMGPDNKMVDFYTLFDGENALEDDEFDTQVGRGEFTVLGGSSINVNYTENNKGTISVLIGASYKAFGGDPIFNNIVVPEFKNSVISKENLLLPKDVRKGGTYAAYINSYDNLKAFVTIDQWTSLYTYIKDAADAFTTQKEVITAEISKLEASIEEVRDAQYLLEQERCLLDETPMSEGNWYASTVVGSSQKNILNGLKEQLLNAIISGNTNIKILVYNDENNTWNYQIMSVDQAVISQKYTIARLEAAIVEAEKNLAEYKTNGKNENGQYEKTLKAAIEDAKQTVVEAEALVSRLNSSLKALLDAYAAK